MLNKQGMTEIATVFFWSIFIGMVGISIGLGALYPPLNLIARPFVCANGTLAYQQQATQTTPDKTYYSADWTCTKADADSEPVNPSYFAGAIYGLVCFPIGLIVKRRLDAKLVAELKADEIRPNSGKESGLP